MPPQAVTRLPLAELWDEAGRVSLTKVRDVGAAAVADLLRDGPVRFVVADLGSGLSWVPADECYRFWKAEVKPRLVEPAAAEAGFRSGDYPGGYCYLASEWAGGPGPVIALEARH
jgi:hypothetical protein